MPDVEMIANLLRVYDRHPSPSNAVLTVDAIRAVLAQPVPLTAHPVDVDPAGDGYRWK